MQITEREQLKVLSSAKELLSGDEDLQFFASHRQETLGLIPVL